MASMRVPTWGSGSCAPSVVNEQSPWRKFRGARPPPLKLTHIFSGKSQDLNEMKLNLSIIADIYFT